MARNLDYLNRGILLVIVGMVWVLYEQGTLTSVLQFAGSVLVLFGVSVVLVALLFTGDQGEVSA